MIDFARMHVTFMVFLIACAAVLSPAVGKADSNNAPSGVSGLCLVPWPRSVHRQRGSFELKPTTVIAADTASMSTARYLRNVLSPATRDTLRIVPLADAPGKNVIVLKQSSDAATNREGYQLLVTPREVRILGRAQAGIFYGIQTLRQLFPPQILANKPPARPTRWVAPCVSIKDQPAYRYRGFMLDPARQFLTVKFIKRFIDVMAFQKMNFLHLHLTDNQAWTIPIRGYPQLTDMKRWSPGAQMAKYARGVYTRKDIHELVEYAAKRHITIVPEIELPAHFSVAGKMLPQVLGPDNPLKTGKMKWTVGSSVHWALPCVGQKQTYVILENILDQVMKMFPSPYIHIGGDEWGGNPWKTCPLGAALIKREHLAQREPGSKPIDLLYRYLMRKICAYIVAKGRTPVFWYDAVWKGYAFPPGSMVHMWWEFGQHPHVKAAKQGLNVIDSKVFTLYFDSGSGARIKPVYDYNPMPAAIAGTSLARHMAGAEAPLWNLKQKIVFAHAYPRGGALAEVLWTPHREQSWGHFQKRLPGYLDQLVALGVNYDGRGLHVVGRWSPAQFRGQRGYTTLRWKVAGKITHAGRYQVELVYRRGRNGVHIKWVKLVANGTVVAQDVHKG